MSQIRIVEMSPSDGNPKESLFEFPPLKWCMSTIRSVWENAFTSLPFTLIPLSASLPLPSTSVSKLRRFFGPSGQQRDYQQQSRRGKFSYDEAPSRMHHLHPSL